MDREQENMQFLGLFDIYRESYNIIRSCTKIFTQITLTLILPLSFIFLIHIELSNVLFSNIMYNSQEEMLTPIETPQYHILSSEWATLGLFKLIFFIFLLIFSLLSTSAVVYTIASRYTSRDVNFRHVISVVPKVWKRLLVTSLCTFVALFTYSFVAMLVSTIALVIWVLMFGLPTNWILIVTSIIIGVFYLCGLVYLTGVWQLAGVVSVLESDSYGFKAMVKSRELLKGKMGLGILIILKLSVSYFVIQFLFTKVVVQGSMNLVERTSYGILCFVLLSLLMLFKIVVQSVLYFVCKSYHHENIDKCALSDHLEVYHGEYEPLKAKEIYLEQYL